MTEPVQVTPFQRWWQQQEYRSTYPVSVMGACEAAWNGALLAAQPASPVAPAPQEHGELFERARRIAWAIRGGKDRCAICSFVLAKNAGDGCVVGNCSYRPHDGSAENERVSRNRMALAEATGIILAELGALAPVAKGETAQPPDYQLPSDVRDIVRQYRYGSTNGPLEEDEIELVENIVNFILAREAAQPAGTELREALQDLLNNYKCSCELDFCDRCKVAIENACELLGIVPPFSPQAIQPAQKPITYTKDGEPLGPDPLQEATQPPREREAGK